MSWQSVNILLVITVMNLFLDVNLYSQDLVHDSSFVYLESGYFYLGNKIGDSDEIPVNKVYINEFNISKYEITNLQYCKFLNDAKIDSVDVRVYIKIGAKASNIYRDDEDFKVLPKFENYPVNFVSWYGANEFCNYYNYRLPTEAEWEFAAKGGKNNIFQFFFKNYKEYSGSNSSEEVAWYKTNSDNKVHEVGLKMPNKKGLYDLSGNLDEWCSDWYSANYYKNSENKNPIGNESGDFKVYRGGSWYNSESLIRITNRRAINPISQKATVGFRVVRDVAFFCPVK